MKVSASRWNLIKTNPSAYKKNELFECRRTTSKYRPDDNNELNSNNRPIAVSDTNDLC